MITRRQATAWAGLALVLGMTALFFMLIQVSPFLSDGSLNVPAVALFVLAVAMGVFGLSSLVALWLHGRWPALAGLAPRKKKALPGSPALRQGVWIALVVVVLAVLAVIQELDIILVLVAFGLVGLLEAYVQSRSK